MLILVKQPTHLPFCRYTGVEIDIPKGPFYTLLAIKELIRNKSVETNI